MLSYVEFLLSTPHVGTLSRSYMYDYVTFNIYFTSCMHVNSVP